jgi:hypothetical protein
MHNERVKLKFTVYGNTYNDIHREATRLVSEYFFGESIDPRVPGEDYDLEFEVENNLDGGTTRKFVATAFVRLKR